MPGGAPYRQHATVKCYDSASCKPQRSAADFLPKSRRLSDLAAAVQRYRGCDFFKNAT